MKRVFYFLHSALALATAAFLTVTGRTGTAAETMKATPLRLAYSAITVNQAIPWISYEAGHFKKYGLDVELIHASSITALQALLAGEVSIAQSVTDACVSSNLNGADTLLMGAILDKPLYSFIVSSKIKTPQDLKGKRVGVTSCQGDAQDVGLRSGHGRYNGSAQRNGSFGSGPGKRRDRRGADLDTE
ncbi:MAG: ABC transporter substrate-binding protein [Deltaproteobacteria bacterium]|nr:MAG: ABC transporter substrate-binding protein [Deltaproteobacteria bacterium]